MIILIAGFFRLPHPGRGLLTSAASGKDKQGRENQKSGAQSGSFVLPKINRSRRN
jgi:hypothetical protein